MTSELERAAEEFVAAEYKGVRSYGGAQIYFKDNAEQLSLDAFLSGARWLLERARERADEQVNDWNLKDEGGYPLTRLIVPLSDLERLCGGEK